MDQRKAETESATSIPCSVSFRFLGCLAVAFLLGCAGFGLVQNFSSQQPLSFSTPALIGFVLSILISGASIVLAISAIMLGKFSEQAMIKRSDESIRLQNEVFQKTTDALQRIESSTGITERRIEDMISGRAGDLSEKIVHIASEKKEARGQLNPKDLEEMIKQSLLQGLKEEGIVTRARYTPEDMAKMKEKEEKAREEQQKKIDLYQEQHMATLRAFAARDGLTALKMGHGTADKQGDDLFDGIFRRDDGERIAITTFSSAHDPAGIRMFTEHSLLEIRNGTVAQVYTILFQQDDAQQKAYSDMVSVAAPELTARTALVICSLDEIEKAIAELDISNKALQAPSGIAPSAAPAAPDADVNCDTKSHK